MLAKQAQRSVSTLMDHPAAQPIRFVTLGYALRNEMVIGLNIAFLGHVSVNRNRRSGPRIDLIEMCIMGAMRVKVPR